MIGLPLNTSGISISEKQLMIVTLVLCSLMICQPAAATSMERVSVTSFEEEVTASSVESAISDDGRFVAFSSRARQLVPGKDYSGTDVFVRDRRNGTTERIPVGSPGCGYSCSASISGDGNIVVFKGPGVIGAINVTDRAAGMTRSLPFNSFDPVVSSNGRYVAFSSSQNLLPDDTNRKVDVFVYDLRASITKRVSVSSSGAEADYQSSSPSISADGRFVAFSSIATNLVPDDTPGVADILIRDRQANTTEQVSVGFSPPPGDGVGLSHPAISADGRFVVFWVNYIVGTPPNEDVVRRLYLRDRQAGTTERVDVNDAGEPANGSSYSGTISADGSIIAFVSRATNLVPEESDNGGSIFIRDRVNETTRKMKTRRRGNGANLIQPVITPDGRFITFHSHRFDLVPGDRNGEGDVFVYDSGDAPDDRDDLLVSFGQRGLWERLNDSTWTQIGGVARVIASGDLDGNTNDEVIAGFNGRAGGLLARYNNHGPWVKLHDDVPLRVVTGDFNGEQTDDLAADFGGQGIWVRVDNGAWTKIQPSTSGGLEVGDLDGDGSDDLIVDLNAGGLVVRFNNAKWVKLRPDSPVRLAAGDLDGDGKDELIADYGRLGILARYNNQGIWVRLPNGGTEAIETGDLDGSGQDDILADLGSRGLWAFYNNAAPWVKLDPRNPAHIAVADLDKDGKADVTADFPPSGVWVRHNNAGPFERITSLSSQGIFASRFD